MLIEREIKRFIDLVNFVSEKSKAEDASFDAYISTENMLPSFGGITKAASLPTSGNVTRFKAGDILFSNIRTYFKKVWQAKFNGFCSNDVLVFRSKDIKQLLPDYLYQICRWDRFTEFSVRTSNGAKMPRGDKDALAEFQISLPSISEQSAIAHILGTLDDKIELNRKMNETLEAMARALFKDWFVDFGPVRAKMEGRWKRGLSLPGLPAHFYDLFPDRLVESELGQIPVGWKVESIGYLAEVSSGKRPEVRFSQPSSDASIPLWGGNGPMAFVNKSLFNEPILLTGRVGTLGSIFRITTPCWPSDNTLVIRTRSCAAFDYLFFQLRQIDFASLNRGSTQPLLTQSDLKLRCLLLPTQEILDQFSLSVCNVYKYLDNAQEQSRTLAVIRDTLLPKLISGELRVKGAEKIIGYET